MPGTQILLHNEEGEFSRGKGLQVGALKMAKMHELLFFCDVDIVFNEQTLRRIRYETKQVRYSAYKQMVTVMLLTTNISNLSATTTVLNKRWNKSLNRI